MVYSKFLLCTKCAILVLAKCSIFNTEQHTCENALSVALSFPGPQINDIVDEIRKLLFTPLCYNFTQCFRIKTWKQMTSSQWQSWKLNNVFISFNDSINFLYNRWWHKHSDSGRDLEKKDVRMTWMTQGSCNNIF